MSTEVGSIHYTLDLDTSRFSVQAAQASAKIQAVGKSMTSLGKRMTLFVTAPIVATGYAAFKAAGEYEQLQIAFTTMLGSAEKARKLLKELDDLAVKTPFTITEVQQSAKQLLAYGVASKDIVKTTRMLGDVSSALGVDTFPRLIYAFGQIKAAGKLYGTELRQLTETGFDLAGAMGLTRSELMKMMQEGDGVSFAQVEEAFEKATSKGGMFFNMMNAQSKTTLGRISNFKDNVTRLIRDIGVTFLPVANQIVDVLNSWIEAFKKLSPQQQNMVLWGIAAAAALGPLLVVIGSLVSSMGVVIGLMASPVFWIFAAVLAVIAGAAYIVYKNWDKIKPVVDETIAGFKEFWKTIKPLREWIVNQFKAAWNDLKQSVNQLREALKPYMPLLKQLAKGFLVVVAGMLTMTAVILTVVARVSAIFVRGMTAIYTSVVNRLGSVLNFIRSIPGKIRAAFRDPWGLLYNIGAAIINGLKNGIVSAFEGVKNFVSGIASWIADHKGPIEKDRKLLVNQGMAIMHGFNSGLLSGYRDVRKTVMGINGDMAYGFGGGNVTNRAGDMKVYGNINIGNRADADYLFSRQTRSAELAAMGLAGA